jgi:hypothetical protein
MRAIGARAERRGVVFSSLELFRNGEKRKEIVKMIVLKP